MLPGRPTFCESRRARVEAGFVAGRSAWRIWQDLPADHGFPGSYESVKRIGRRLLARLSLRRAWGALSVGSAAVDNSLLTTPEARFIRTPMRNTLMWPQGGTF